jgi:hypothetical protein
MTANKKNRMRKEFTVMSLKKMACAYGMDLPSILWIQGIKINQDKKAIAATKNPKVIISFLSVVSLL